MKGTILVLLLVVSGLTSAAEISIEVFEESITPKGKANTTSEISGPIILSAKSDTTSDKNETVTDAGAAADPKSGVGVPVDLVKEIRELEARNTSSSGPRDHAKRFGDTGFSVQKGASDPTAAESSVPASFSLPPGGGGRGVWSFAPDSMRDDESRSFDRLISGWNQNFRNQQQDSGRESASSGVSGVRDPVVARRPAIGDPSLADLEALLTSSSHHHHQQHESSGIGIATHFGPELGLSALYPGATAASGMQETSAVASGGGILRKYMGRIPRIVRRPTSIVKGVIFKKNKKPHKLPKILRFPTTGLPFRGLWKVSKFRFFGRKKKPVDTVAQGAAGMQTVLPVSEDFGQPHPDLHLHQQSLLTASAASDLNDKQLLALLVPKNLHMTPLHHHWDHQQIMHMHTNNNRPAQQAHQHKQFNHQSQQNNHNKNNPDIGFKPDLHFLEDDGEDDDFPKDGHPVLPDEPHTGLHSPHVQPQPHFRPNVPSLRPQVDAIPSDIRDLVKQYEHQLPEQVKQQLIQGKIPAGLPPQLSALASAFSPDQIRGMAAALLTQRPEPVFGQPNPSAGREQNQNQESAGLRQQQLMQEAKQAALSGVRQNQDPGTGHNDISNRPLAGQESQVRPSVFRHVFRPQFLRHLRPRPAAPPLMHQESVFADETLSVFESEHEPSIRIPEQQDGEELMGQQEQQRRPQERPNSQIVPLDGRPNGSPHLDQVEHMLSAALYQQAQQQDGRQPEQMILVQGRGPVTGMRLPIFVPQQIPLQKQQQSFIRNPNQYRVQDQAYGPSFRRKPVLLGPQVRPPLAPQMPNSRKPVLLQSHRVPIQNQLRQVSAPKFQSTYSNGWIPKDLPHDWSPGQAMVRSPPESFRFTATDSITPTPRLPVTTSPANAQPSVRPTVTPTTGRTTSTTTPDPDFYDEPQPLPTPSSPSSPVPVEATSPRGKQELIKLWLSQKHVPAVTSTTTSSTTTTSTTTTETPVVTSAASVHKKATFPTRKPVTGSRKPRVYHVPKDEQSVTVPFPVTPRRFSSRTSATSKPMATTTTSTTTTTTTTPAPETETMTLTPSTTTTTTAATRLSLAQDFSSEREAKVEPVSDPVSRPGDDVVVEALSVSSSAQDGVQLKEGIIRNEEKTVFGSKRHSFDRIPSSSPPPAVPLTDSPITHAVDPLTLSESRVEHETEITPTPKSSVDAASATTTPGPVYISSPSVPEIVNPWTSTSISIVTTPTSTQESGSDQRLSRRSSVPVGDTLTYGQRMIDKKVGLVRVQEDEI